MLDLSASFINLVVDVDSFETAHHVEVIWLAMTAVAIRTSAPQWFNWFWVVRAWPSRFLASNSSLRLYMLIGLCRSGHFKGTARCFCPCHSFLQHFNVIELGLCDASPFRVAPNGSDCRKSVIRDNAIAAGKHHIITSIFANAISLHDFLAIAEVFLRDMSILDCSTAAGFLTVDITEVVNGLAGAETWECPYAAPWGDPSMVKVGTSRSIEDVLLGDSVELITGVTVSFLDYPWGRCHMVFYLRDGGLVAALRIWRQNWRSRLVCWILVLWCCLSDIDFLDTDGRNGSSGTEADRQRLLRNWVQGLVSFRSTVLVCCVHVAVLASEGTFTATISCPRPQKWRVREDASVARERDSCLIQLDWEWFLRVVN